MNPREWLCFRWTSILMSIAAFLACVTALSQTSGPDWRAAVTVRVWVERPWNAPPGELTYISVLLNGSAAGAATYSGSVWGSPKSIELDIGREYSLDGSDGEFWSNAKVVINAPPGYMVLIDGQRRPSISFTPSNTYATVTIVEAQLPDGDPIYATLRPTTGNLVWTLPVGKLSSSLSAGAITLRAEDLASVFTPAALTYSRPDSAEIDPIYVSGQLRQVKTLYWLFDIQTFSGGYDINCYKEGDFSTTKVGGLYPPNTGATPVVKYTLQNVSGFNETRLQIKRTYGNSALIAQVAHTAGEASWQQVMIWGNGPGFVTRDEFSTFVGAEETKTIEGKTLSGQVVRKTQETHRVIATDSNGRPRRELVKRIEDPDTGGKAYTDEWDYYIDPNDQSSFGKVKWHKAPDGNWTKQDYWSDTSSKNGKVKYTYKPWLDSPSGPEFATLTSGEVTFFDYYTGSLQGVEGKLTLKQKTINGTMVEKSTFDYAAIINNAKTVIVETERQYFDSGASSYLTTVRKYYDPLLSTGSAWFRSKAYSETDPTGARRAFLHHQGTRTVQGQFNISPLGTHWREMVLSGSSLSSSGGRRVLNFGTTADNEVDEVYLIPNESVLEVNFTELTINRPVRQEVWVYVGDGGSSTTVDFNAFQLVGWMDYSYLSGGRISQRTNDRGQIHQWTYYPLNHPYENLLESETDETGIRSVFEYGYGARLEKTIREGAPSTGGLPAISQTTNVFWYDLFGRRYKTETTGTGTEILYSEDKYDLGGRLIENRDINGVIRKTSYERQGANTWYSITRQQVVERVGSTDTVLAETISETHRDGRLKSVTGNGAVNSFMTYEVLSDGKFKVTARSGSATSPRLTETVTDWLGRVLSVTEPTLR